MGRELPEAGRKLRTHRLYLPHWLRLLLPYLMPLLTTLVSYEKWLEISFISREAEVNPRAPKTPHIWSFQKLVHCFLLK
jgi:aspartyl/asparaginyl beta-hydroxylase (cupin superfamily)